MIASQHRAAALPPAKLLLLEGLSRYLTTSLNSSSLRARYASSSPACACSPSRLLPYSSRLQTPSSRRHYSIQPQPQLPQQPKESPPPDHRDLGIQQELFTTSIYSPGSPIFLPNGARIFNRLVDFLRKQYVRYGFQEVITPTIYKKALWAKSGHLDNYADDMFTVTSASLARKEKNEEEAAGVAAAEEDNDEEKDKDGSHHHHHHHGIEDEYGLKPMNCPGHCLIFAAQRHSYRDLPIRYADFSPLHRNEISGALSGLTRVRRFHQDDGHIFCLPSQVEEEILATLDFVRHTYDVLGLGPYRLVLSTRPTDGHLIGTAADWDAAEDALRRALDRSGRAWTVSPGDGAFYGPKIDIVLRDSDGKEHQTATVQLDFQLPKRFELTYQGGETSETSSISENSVSEKSEPPEPSRPVLIHRAVLGSVERLLALLIEHYNGRWPFWLNPRQVAVLTVNDSEPVVAFARHVQSVLSGTAPTATATATAGERSTRPSISAPSLLAAVDVDDSARTLPLKVREAKSKGYGAVVVVGPKDVARGTVAVDLSGVPLQEKDSSSSSSSSSSTITTTTAGGAREKPKKSIDMKPEELLALLLHKASTYQ